MSIKVMTWVWDHSPTKGSERLVLLALADNAGDDDWKCWPSLATIAHKTQLGRRQVIRIIQQLEVDGLIEVERAAHQSNSYTIIPASEKMSLPSDKMSLPPPSDEMSPPSDIDVTSASDIAMSPESSIEPSVNRHSAPTEPAPAAENPHTVGMRMLHEYVGPYPDGKAQGEALKWMLSQGATLEQIRDQLLWDIQEMKNSDRNWRVSFLTVRKNIFQNPAPTVMAARTSFPSAISNLSPPKLEPLFPTPPTIIDYDFMAPRSKEEYDQ